MSWPDEGYVDLDLLWREVFANEEDLAAALRYDLAWLESKCEPGYVWNVVRRHGVNAFATRPKLYVGTIHSFKGAEADTVIVYPDLSYKGMETYYDNPQSVIRMFYVAFTRAREKLVLCQQISPLAVRFPTF
jgi:hypothetical protein